MTYSCCVRWPAVTTGYPALKVQRHLLIACNSQGYISLDHSTRGLGKNTLNQRICNHRRFCGGRYIVNRPTSRCHYSTSQDTASCITIYLTIILMQCIPRVGRSLSVTSLNYLFTYKYKCKHIFTLNNISLFTT